MMPVLCYVEKIAAIENPMEIRRARAADLEASATLWYERMAMLRESASWIEFAPDAMDRWRKRAKNWIDDADHAFYVAEADGQIIGMAVVAASEGKPGLYPDRVGVLMQLAVDLHYPHSGLSGRLFEAAKSWLLSNDISVLDICAPATYPVEDAFWRAQGAALNALQYRLRL